MGEPNTDVIQGTLDMLILKTLSLEPLHGFGIARRVEQISRGVFKVNPGSLLTALQRLERGGRLDAEWRQTANSRRAKFYSLTRDGEKTARGRNRRLEAPTHRRCCPTPQRGGLSMSFWRQLTRGVRVLANRAAADQDLSDEVRHYLEQAAAANVERGLSPSAARRAAQLEIGNATAVREQMRAYGWENVVATCSGRSSFRAAAAAQQSWLHRSSQR